MACALFEPITLVFHYFQYSIGARPLGPRTCGRIFPYIDSILEVIRPARGIPLLGNLDSSSIISEFFSVSSLRDQMISFTRVILVLIVSFSSKDLSRGSLYCGDHMSKTFFRHLNRDWIDQESFKQDISFGKVIFLIHEINAPNIVLKRPAALT